MTMFFRTWFLVLFLSLCSTQSFLACADDDTGSILGADEEYAEVHIPLAWSSTLPAVRIFHLNDPMLRQHNLYYFDTKDLLLSGQGMLLRARIQVDPSYPDSPRAIATITVKVRPSPEAGLRYYFKAANLANRVIFRPAHFIAMELDDFPLQMASSFSISRNVPRAEVISTTLGQNQVANLFSLLQKELIARNLNALRMSPAALANELRILGPIATSERSIPYAEFMGGGPSRKVITVRHWFPPGGEDSARVELIVKVPRSRTNQERSSIVSALRSRGLHTDTLAGGLLSPILEDCVRHLSR